MIKFTSRSSKISHSTPLTQNPTPSTMPQVSIRTLGNRMWRLLLRAGSSPQYELAKSRSSKLKYPTPGLYVRAWTHTLQCPGPKQSRAKCTETCPQCMLPILWKSSFLFPVTDTQEQQGKEKPKSPFCNICSRKIKTGKFFNTRWFTATSVKI